MVQLSSESSPGFLWVLYRALEWLSPALVVLFATVSLLRSFSYPKPIQRVATAVKELFSPQLTPQDVLTPEELERNKRPLDGRKCAFLACSSALLCAGWFVVTGYLAASNVHTALQPAAYALSWAYAAGSLCLWPSITPDYNVFALAIVQTTFHGSRLWVFAQSPRDVLQDTPLRLHTAALIVCVAIIFCILSKPLLDTKTSSNTADIDEKQCSDQYTSPEDNVNLYQWLSFAWIWPLLSKGSRKDLKIDDIWQLSPLNWAKNLHQKFKSKTTKSLAWKLLVLNWVDILADGGLQIGSFFSFS